MKKKIGIITIEGNKNYGNKLQNYALQNIINRMGYDPYTLWQKDNFITKTKKILKKIYFSSIKKNKFKINMYKREEIFENFTREYLKIWKINRKKIKKLDNDFYSYVIGSDQVWNPDIIDRYLGLEIFNNNNKKIAYSPSIAQKKVDSSFEEKIKKNLTLKKIRYISLREETGCELVKKITNRNDIMCTLDPTLLLEDTEWEKIMSKPKFIKEKKYILCYFLGNVSSEKKHIIEEYAQKNSCEIIDILNPNKPEYFSSPNEFLYLEKNAFAIFTDSFHSSVFGFIFKKPFFVFERDDNLNDMSSRLVDFLDKFDLNEQMIKKIDIKKINRNIDYSNGNKILLEERNRSLLFLEKALKDD